jgi:hypothetical protein
MLCQYCHVIALGAKNPFLAAIEVAVVHILRLQAVFLNGSRMMLEWIRGHELALWWIGTLSLVVFFVTLILVAVLVVHIPSDYFLRKKRTLANLKGRYSVIRLTGIVVKNIFGIVFVLAGLAMLVLPGQGIITILIGIMMLNFPGKRSLERRIVQQPKVLRAINWMRTKANKPVLQVPHIGSKGKKMKMGSYYDHG